MNAEYTGYVVKMPKEFDTEVARIAVRHHIAALKVLREKINKPGYNWEADKLELTIDLYETVYDAADWCDFYDHLDHNGLLKYIFTRPEDCLVRVDPDNPNLTLVGCGDMTFGRDADNETCEWLLALDKLGLYPVLGIR
jgi:hypothetical protein